MIKFKLINLLLIGFLASGLQVKIYKGGENMRISKRVVIDNENLP